MIYYQSTNINDHTRTVAKTNINKDIINSNKIISDVLRFAVDQRW